MHIFTLSFPVTPAASSSAEEREEPLMSRTERVRQNRISINRRMKKRENRKRSLCLHPADVFRKARKQTPAAIRRPRIYRPSSCSHVPAFIAACVIGGIGLDRVSKREEKEGSIQRSAPNRTERAVKRITDG